MIDINLIRTNPELVKENIKKKFQDHKLPLVDKALELDAKRRALIAEGDALRSARNTLSKKVGEYMKAGNREEAEKVKAQVKADAERLLAIEKENEEVDAELKKTMMTIPKTWNYNVSAKRACPNSKCRIIWIFWKNLTGST